MGEHRDQNNGMNDDDLDDLFSNDGKKTTDAIMEERTHGSKDTQKGKTDAYGSDELQNVNEQGEADKSDGKGKGGMTDDDLEDLFSENNEENLEQKEGDMDQSEENNDENANISERKEDKSNGRNDDDLENLFSNDGQKTTDASMEERPQGSKDTQKGNTDTLVDANDSDELQGEADKSNEKSKSGMTDDDLEDLFSEKNEDNLEQNEGDMDLSEENNDENVDVSERKEDKGNGMNDDDLENLFSNDGQKTTDASMKEETHGGKDAQGENMGAPVDVKESDELRKDNEEGYRDKNKSKEGMTDDDLENLFSNDVQSKEKKTEKLDQNEEEIDQNKEFTDQKDGMNDDDLEDVFSNDEQKTTGANLEDDNHNEETTANIKPKTKDDDYNGSSGKEEKELMKLLDEVSGEITQNPKEDVIESSNFYDAIMNLTEPQTYQS